MGILRPWRPADFRAVHGRAALRWTLCVVLCMTFLGVEGSSKKCVECETNWTSGCGICATLGVAKRGDPTMYDDFGAFLRKWIRANSEAPSCELTDIYKAIPPRCHAKLDWIVSQAEGFQ